MGLPGGARLLRGPCHHLPLVLDSSSTQFCTPAHPPPQTARVFTGNRPSLSVLLPELNAYTVGQLLALYEHQVAVQGFVWNINSFDQWGVELGKVGLTFDAWGLWGGALASGLPARPASLSP